MANTQAMGGGCFILFLRQGLTGTHCTDRLALDPQKPTCLFLLSSSIKDKNHHTCPQDCFNEHGDPRLKF